MALSCRAYGYCAMEKYELALHDFKRIKNYSKLGQASAYNKYMSAGILAMDSEDFLMGCKHF